MCDCNLPSLFLSPLDPSPRGDAAPLHPMGTLGYYWRLHWGVGCARRARECGVTTWCHADCSLVVLGRRPAAYPIATPLCVSSRRADVCPICIEPLDGPPQGDASLPMGTETLASCKHTTHRHCLGEHARFKFDVKCPTCRGFVPSASAARAERAISEVCPMTDAQAAAHDDRLEAEGPYTGGSFTEAALARFAANLSAEIQTGTSWPFTSHDLGVAAFHEAPTLPFLDDWVDNDCLYHFLAGEDGHLANLLTAAALQVRFGTSDLDEAEEGGAAFSDDEKELADDYRLNSDYELQCTIATDDARWGLADTHVVVPFWRGEGGRTLVAQACACNSPLLLLAMSMQRAVALPPFGGGRALTDAGETPLLLAVAAYVRAGGGATDGGATYPGLDVVRAFLHMVSMTRATIGARDEEGASMTCDHARDAFDGTLLWDTGVDVVPLPSSPHYPNSARMLARAQAPELLEALEAGLPEYEMTDDMESE